jgi:hypothetical protein
MSPLATTRALTVTAGVTSQVSASLCPTTDCDTRSTTHRAHHPRAQHETGHGR